MGIGGIGSFIGGFGGGLSQGMSNEQNMQLRKMQMQQYQRGLDAEAAATRAGVQVPAPFQQGNRDPNAGGAGLAAGPGSPHTGGLEPGFAGNINNLMQHWNTLHPNDQASIISAYRSAQQQAGLTGYHAAPGMSAHQLGAAADLRTASRNPADLRQMGAMAPQYGVYWGGNWRRPDMPHFQAYPGFQQRDQWRQQHYDWLKQQGYI